jgi:hypothetical protein
MSRKLKLIIATVVAALGIGVAAALASELTATAEVSGSTVSAVTVEQGGSTPFTINVGVTGNAACGATASAKVNTAYSLDASGTLSSGTPSATMNFASPGTGGNCVEVKTDAASSYAKSASVSADAATPVGDYTVPLSFTNITNSNVMGGKLGDSTTQSITVHVVAPAPPADTTPPTIDYTLNPTDPDGDNGWYKSNVTLTWTVTENESAGSLVKTGCVDQDITADQTATTYSCSASSDGGSAGPETVTIKRDATAPTLQLKPSLDSCDIPGDNGWCRGTQSAGFQASDATSGFGDPSQASFSFTKTSSTNGSNIMIASGAVKDNAGNVASSIDAGPFMIDSVKPVVSVTGVSDGATYTLGSVPTAGCDTTDATSGVKDAATLSLTGGPVGSVTATCSGAKDNAGNTGSASVTYNVIFDWNGFFRPVDNPDVLNVAKAGSAIPVKFSLSGNQGLTMIMASGYPASKVVSCATVDDAGTDAIEETITAGASSLQYDATTDQYIYVWKTDKNWAGSCRQLQVQLTDGTRHVANFKLTK